jgi:hypothetical protein
VVADFVNGLSDELLKMFSDLREDKTSFEELGISYEEKAFYDILVKVRDDHQFKYEDEKCLHLAKKIKELVDDKAQFVDWSKRDDIKNELNMQLTVLLYQNGYPPEWDEEVLCWFNGNWSFSVFELTYSNGERLHEKKTKKLQSRGKSGHSETSPGGQSGGIGPV